MGTSAADSPEQRDPPPAPQAPRRPRRTDRSRRTVHRKALPGQLSWHHEKEWADGHREAIERVVRAVAHHIVEITPSSFQDDTEHAIDYDISLSAGAMACRIRRDETCPYRDLTMTTSRPSGARCEVDKVLGGTVRWYLYAWAEAGGFVDWMFVDLDVVREARLIERARRARREKRSGDGSRFLYIPFLELARAGAVVASTLPRPEGGARR